MNTEAQHAEACTPNAEVLPAPGFHYGVAYEDYAAWPAINFSRLKPIRKTASKCRYEMDHPKAPTPAMVLGSSLHVATLEPARFEQLFHICPPCDRRNAEGKKIYDDAVKAAGGRLLIRSGSKEDEALLGEVGKLRDMAKAIHGSKVARKFLDAAGQNEVSALWRDEETGLMCKGRFDKFIPEFPLWNCAAVVEIKTSRDADNWSFAKDCHVMGYAAQAAGYCHAVKRITGKSCGHIFLVVENFPPHDFMSHQLDDASLQTGLLQYRQMLNRYADCVKSGQWPGYPDKVNILSLPKWANQEAYE